jgi:hypothetical protein
VNLYDSSCSALLRHLEAIDANGEATQLLGKDEYATRIALLVESLRAFLDIEWYHKGVVDLMGKYLSICESNEVSSFNHGRLEELLKCYCTSAVEVPLSPYKQAKEWLSRVFKNKTT